MPIELNSAEALLLLQAIRSTWAAELAPGRTPNVAALVVKLEREKLEGPCQTCGAADAYRLESRWVPGILTPPGGVRRPPAPAPKRLCRDCIAKLKKEDDR